MTQCPEHGPCIGCMTKALAEAAQQQASSNGHALHVQLLGTDDLAAQLGVSVPMARRLMATDPILRKGIVFIGSKRKVRSDTVARYIDANTTIEASR